MNWILILLGLSAVCAVAYFLLTRYSKDSGGIQERTKDQSAKYSTKMNRFAARKETKAAHARADLATELNFEMERVVRLNRRTDPSRDFRF